MTTIRYGTSVGPARITQHVQEAGEEHGAKSFDDANSDALMQCPYDKNHQIRVCRFPFHILKCAKNHPGLAKELKMCPFNAKHLVPSHKLADHIEHCANSNTNMHPKFHVPIKWTPPACDEDWEEEADDSTPTFVWGGTSNILPVNNPQPPVVNLLNAGVRSPRVFPWDSYISHLLCYDWLKRFVVFSDWVEVNH